MAVEVSASVADETQASAMGASAADASSTLEAQEASATREVRGVRGDADRDVTMPASLIALAILLILFGSRVRRQKCMAREVSRATNAGPCRKQGVG